MYRYVRWLTLSLTVLTLVPATMTFAQAPSGLESVWAGKTMTLITCLGPGTAGDILARLIARHMPRFLPGRPNMIVVNIVGAGGRVATNQIYLETRGDGLTIFGCSRAVPTFQLQGDPGVRYDVSKIPWLGSVGPEPTVLVVHKRAGITRADQLKTREFKIPMATPGSSPHLPLVILRKVLGWQLKPVFGFESSTEIVLAVDRGDTDTMMFTWATMLTLRRAELEAKTLIPLVVIGRAGNDLLLARVPTARQLFAAKNQADLDLLTLAERPNDIGWPFGAPPGTRPDILRALRKAFMDTMEDSLFIAAAKSININVAPISGEELLGMMTQYINTPKVTRDELTRLIQSDVP